MGVNHELIDKADRLFMRYGIRSVSMDDIAKELSVSKKTLYQWIDNKTDLIHHIFMARMEADKREIDRLSQSADNALEELVAVGRYMISQLREVSPTFRYDLEKYYPDIHKKMDEFHGAYFEAFMTKNLEWGMKEGYYRKNLHPQLIAKFFINAAIHTSHNEVFPIELMHLDMQVQQFFLYHIHGIATTKGTLLVRRLIGEEEQEAF